MNSANILRLILLAAIWGASFLFIRISVAAFGPAMLVELRVGIAALFLWLVSTRMKKSLSLSSHWRHYLIIGVVNSALPFLLFAYAAGTLSASLLSILNSTAPIFGAVVASIWLRTPMDRSTIIGLIIGMCGVGLLVGSNVSIHGDNPWLPLIAGLGAPLCYGIASTYTKANAVKLDPFNNAHGSLWMATLINLPMAFAAPPIHNPTMVDWAAATGLSVLCTGFAYLLYFRLIEDVGPMRALTVTFLIPVFGVLWGTLFLGEPVGWNLLIGGVMILLGTGLANGVLRFSGTHPVISEKG